MMNKFNFGDFQKSWKTDRHWELKREFIERYKNTFKEEKLLSYLAEVYANVILMKCRYPEPLMKEITELSKPLQMHKQFEEINGNVRVKRFINEQEDTEKINCMHEHFKRPSKQLKTFANEGCSTFPVNSINPLHSVKEQFSDIFSVPLNSKEDSQILLQLKQVLKASKNHSKQTFELANFCTNERQFNSTDSIASTNVPPVEQFRKRYSVPLYNEQDSQVLSTSEPVYKTPEHSRPFKQVKFYASEESTFFVADTDSDVLQPSMEQFKNTYCIPFLEEQSVQNLSKSQQAFKRSAEYSESFVKHIDFPAHERQSSSIFSPTSLDELQSPVEHFKNAFSIPFLEEHVSQSLSESEQNLKNSIEHSKTSFKQMNFNANKEQPRSTILSTSIDVLQPLLEKFRNAYAIPFLEEHDVQNVSKSEQDLKKSVKHSEIPFKQMNLYVNEGQSSSKISPPSTNIVQSFEKQLCNAYVTPFFNEQDVKILPKSEQILKTPERFSEKSCKQINCTDEEQSSSTISTNMLQHSIKEFTNTCSTPFQCSIYYPKGNEQKVEFLPKSEQTFETTLDKKRKTFFKIKNIFIEKKKADSILSALGLTFIQRFAEHAKNCVTRFSSAIEILQHTCFKFKVWHQCSFEVDRDPDSPKQAALFFHKFYLKGCLIACETAMKKKKGKTLVAEAALNTLVTLGTLDRSKASEIHRLIPKEKKPVMNTTKFFDIFSKNVINRTKDEPAIITLKSIASLLDMEEDCVVFKVASNIVADCTTEYTSKLFLNGILISSAKDDSIQSSKNLAAEFALIKLSNLTEYVIHKGELKNRLDYLKDVHSVSSSSSKTHTKEKHPFILNKNLFESSIRDEVMLIQRDKAQINIQRNLRDIILDSANYSHSHMAFDLEEINTNTPSYIKITVRIGSLELGSGVAFSKDQARTIACVKAFMDMQRKYYTLRVKDEYIEGFLVTLDQVINDESYSKNKIKNQYLRVGKVKKKKAVFTVEFPGTDINDSIEVTTKQPLSKNERFCTEMKSSNEGTEPLITDTKTTVTDIEPTSINASLESTEKYHNFSLFVEKLEIMLQKFQESEDYCDLLFPGYTPIHRGLIVKTVKKLHLRSVFLIDESKTHVCVKHRYEVTELLNFLVKNGGSSSKFELIDASKTVI